MPMAICPTVIFVDGTKCCPVSFRLLEFVENRQVVVCESGISTRADLARLRQRGVNIALIGEHLLRQPDPGRALHELLGRPGKSKP